MKLEEGNRMAPLMAVRCCFENSKGERTAISDIHITRIHHEAKEVHFFTGAYDFDSNRKRKPIYEGDIIEVQYRPEFWDGKSGSFIGVIRYEPYRTSFNLIVDKGEYAATYSVGFDGSAVLSKKVIGNLWTSPELLPQ